MPADHRSEPAGVLLALVATDGAVGGGLDTLAADRGYRRVLVADADEARAAISGDVDVAVVGLDVPGALGVLEALRRRFVPVVAIASEHHGLPDRWRAADTAAGPVLAAGRTHSEVLDAVDAAMDRPRRVAGHVVAVLDPGDTCRAVVHALQAVGVPVTVAHGPVDVEASMTTSGDVDLLIIGARVAGLDGPALCRVIRGDPRHAELPVLITAASPDRDVIRDAAMSGAEGVVTEPIDPAALRARTIGLIERSRTLKALAETDRLTGLANRHKLDEELTRFMSLADRFDQPLTLTLIDLDHFKDVNDRHGHLLGDAVLRAVARLLCDRYRGEDVVARWGGEELAIVSFGMPMAVSADRATDALRALRATNFPSPGAPSFRVTFSAGVAEYPTGAANQTELYRAADSALYTAKATGRNRVVTTP